MASYQEISSQEVESWSLDIGHYTNLRTSLERLWKDFGQSSQSVQKGPSLGSKSQPTLAGGNLYRSHWSGPCDSSCKQLCQPCSTGTLADPSPRSKVTWLCWVSWVVSF